MSEGRALLDSFAACVVPACAKTPRIHAMSFTAVVWLPGLHVCLESCGLSASAHNPTCSRATPNRGSFWKQQHLLFRYIIDQWCRVHVGSIAATGNGMFREGK